MGFLFASFHRKQLGTMLLDTARNSALKLVNLPSITNYYRGLYGGEHKLAPHHTNVCKNSRLQKLKTRGRVDYCARLRKASDSSESKRPIIDDQETQSNQDVLLHQVHLR